MTAYLNGMNGRASVLSGDPPAADLDITKWSAKPTTPVATFGSSFNEGWKVGVPGTAEVTGNLEGKAPEDGYLPERGTLVELDLRVEDDEGETTLLSIAGQAVLGEVSVEVDTDNGEPVAWSATFESVGPWTKTEMVESVVVLDATPETGHLQCISEVSWAAARSGPPTGAYVGFDAFAASAAYQEREAPEVDSWEFQRAFLQFDASAVEAPVVAAQLRLVLAYNYNPPNDIRVGKVAADWADLDEEKAAVWDAEETTGEVQDAEPLSPNDPLLFDLNPSWIESEDSTCLVVRQKSNDVDDVELLESVQVGAAFHGVSAADPDHRPKLILTVVEPQEGPL